jgi:hypothetical protein
MPSRAKGGYNCRRHAVVGFLRGSCDTTDGQALLNREAIEIRACNYAFCAAIGTKEKDDVRRFGLSGDTRLCDEKDPEEQ